MAAPLAMPVIWIVRPANFNSPPDDLVHRVRRHHPACGSHERVLIRAQLVRGACDARGDFFQRQEFADDAGRKHQRLPRGGSTGSSRQLSHFFGVVQSALSGAGVGVTGVHHYSEIPRPVCGSPVEDNGGSLKSILCVDTGRYRWDVGHH